MLPPKKLQATEWEEGAEGHKDRPIGVFRGVDEGKGMPNRRVGGGCLWASSVLSQSRSSGLPASEVCCHGNQAFQLGRRLGAAFLRGRKGGVRGC